MLVKRFPRLSETFILNEFLELRRQGLPLDLFAIMEKRGRTRLTSGVFARALKREVRLATKLVDRAGGKNGGIVSPKGPAGSMILFHSCLVHASTSNLSPWNRVSVYLSLCAVSNHIRRFKRPEYIAHRDFTEMDFFY